MSDIIEKAKALGLTQASIYAELKKRRKSSIIKGATTEIMFVSDDEIAHEFETDENGILQEISPNKLVEWLEK